MQTENYKNYFVSFIRWLILCLIIGALGGVIGALFSKSIGFVTELRAEHGWLLYLLPFGGLVTVAIYKLLKVDGISTNRVLESVRSDKSVPFLVAPAVFAGTVITHLLGGSAGREGAALQIGGGMATLASKIFKPDEELRHTLTQCGMAAVFSALFGTPLGACVFALEVIRVGYIRLAAVFPCVVSSVTAFMISQLFGAEAERFNLSAVPQLGLSALWRVAVIAVLCASVSFLFCRALHFSEHGFKKLIKNDFLRIFAGGALIAAVSFLLGTSDYNGGGMHIVARIFENGEVKPEAFLLKMLLTVLTVAAGYKGGEIVPTLFIGATFGATVAALIGLSPALGAAVGMVALFCGVTNCPIASIFIGIELFGAEGAVYFAVASAISFLLSGYSGLYFEQKIMFSKLDDTPIDRNAE